MKVDFHTGEESWLADGYGEPQFTYYGGLDYEIVVHTTRGVVTMMVSPGVPELTQAHVDALTVALRERLDERFKEEAA
jgi:hypothetical protein